MRMQLDSGKGSVEKPAYEVRVNATRGHGNAERIEMEGDNKYKVLGGNYTSCDVGETDWFVRAKEFEIDKDRQIGTARGAQVLVQRRSANGFTGWVSYAYGRTHLRDDVLGKLRVLALTGAKRWKGMPDVPTMQESGFKGYDLINWFGLWLPAGASPAIVDRLHKEVVKALAQPEVIRQFDIQGLEGVGCSPAEFLKFAQKESAFMNDLARKIAAAPK